MRKSKRPRVWKSKRASTMQSVLPQPNPRDAPPQPTRALHTLDSPTQPTCSKPTWEAPSQPTCSQPTQDAVDWKSNGPYVNDEARIIREKLNVSLSQEDQSQHSVLSPNDTFGEVFRKEHRNCVCDCDLCMDICPTSMFVTGSQRFGENHSNSSTGANPITQEDIESLKSQLRQVQDELAELQEKVSAIMNFIKEMGWCIPSSLANNKFATQQVGAEVNIQSLQDQNSSTHGGRPSRRNNNSKNTANRAHSI